MKRVHSGLVLILALGLVWMGCDSDDGGSKDNGVTQDVPQQDPGGTTDTGVDTTPVEKVTFKAQVQDNLSKQPMAGAQVTVMDNDTGEATAMTTTADAEGMVTFELEKGRLYGFRSVLVDCKDTYVWNVSLELPEGEEYETIWLLSEMGFVSAAALAGFTPDPTKSIIAGALYWVNDAGAEEYVSCGTIKTDPEAEYRYFSTTTGYPAPLATVQTTGAGKAEGRYVAGNVPAGHVELSGYNKDGSVKWASEMLWTKADSVAISNLYVDRTQFTTNPSPATCD